MAHPEERILDCDATDRYEAYVTRRSHGEPVAYVLGEKEFWSLPLAVTPDVLIPRPETELVVELALTHLPRDHGRAGAGSRHRQRRHRACHCAGTAPRHRGRHRHLRGGHQRGPAQCAATAASPTSSSARAAGSIRSAGQRFDLIASNPPYIAEGDDRVEPGVRRFEPHGALFAGTGRAGGIACDRRVGWQSPAAGGWLVVEHGDRQGPAVRELLARRRIRRRDHPPRPGRARPLHRGPLARKPRGVTSSRRPFTMRTPSRSTSCRQVTQP